MTIFRGRGYLAIEPRALGVDVPEFEAQPVRVLNDVAVVPIRGPLEHHDDPFFCSYEVVTAAVCSALQSPEVRAVVLQLDSPGGVVAGLFDAARAIRAESIASAKPLIAYVDGMATSAAYALACAASQIVIADTAELGSIGVIAGLCDARGADEQAGLRYEFFTSGKRKADGNPHVQISDPARQAAQANVDLLADLFFDWVATSRPLSAAEVAAMQAGTYLGRLAVEAGLADAIGTLPATIANATKPRDVAADQRARDAQRATRAAAPKRKALTHAQLEARERRADELRWAAQTAEHQRRMASDPAYRVALATRSLSFGGTAPTREQLAQSPMLHPGDLEAVEKIERDSRQARGARRPLRRPIASGAPFAQLEDD